MLGGRWDLARIAGAAAVFWGGFVQGGRFEVSRGPVTIGRLMRNGIRFVTTGYEGGGDGWRGFRVGKTRVDVFVVVICGLFTIVRGRGGLG